MAIREFDHDHWQDESWRLRFVQDRVRTEFEEADYIPIPTRFVGRTFLEHGISEAKLLYSAYGVDHEKFKAQIAPRDGQPF
jgi:hypothetical protein